MQRVVLSLWLLSCVLLTGCSVKIPDATFTCRNDEGCPAGFRCGEGLCRRGALDDASTPLDGSAQQDCDDDRCQTDSGVTDDAASTESDAQSSDAEPPDAQQCSAETCNGVDDNCDQQVDEGQLRLRTILELAGAKPYYVRILPLPDGGALVLQSLRDDAENLYRITATRFSATGAIVLGPREVNTALDGRFEAVVVDDGFVVLRSGAWLVLTSFALSDFAERSDAMLVSTEPRSSHVLDLVATHDALGSRLWVLFDAQGVVSLASFRAPTLAVHKPRTVLHTPAANEPMFMHGRLVAGPCDLGLYAALIRRGPPSELRVLALSGDGVVSGPSFRRSYPAPEVAMAVARPALVAGGCEQPPSELLVSWTSAPLPDASDKGFVHTVGIALSASANTDLSPAWETTVETSPVFLEVVFNLATAPIAMSHTRTGRIFVAAATIAAGGSVGGLDLHEIYRTGHTRHLTEVAPRMPSVIDMASVGNAGENVWLAMSSWLDKRSTQLSSLECR